MKRHTNFIDRLGERHISNEGCKFEIIKYQSKRDCTIQFENGFILNSINYDHIKRGTIKNPYHPSVYGVGYNGVGRHIISIAGRHTKAAQTWKGMLERCYDEKSRVKHPTYKDVTVCEEWHNFQVFGDWFEQNYKECFELDKDILFKCNKIYSPKTCRFVPKEINGLFTYKKSNKGEYPAGVCKSGNKYTFQLSKYKGRLRKIFDTPEEASEAYKIAKETHIREIADKWREEIDLDVYNAMYNHSVETATINSHYTLFV